MNRTRVRVAFLVGCSTFLLLLSLLGVFNLLILHRMKADAVQSLDTVGKQLEDETAIYTIKTIGLSTDEEGESKGAWLRVFSPFERALIAWTTANDVSDPRLVALEGHFLCVEHVMPRQVDLLVELPNGSLLTFGVEIEDIVCDPLWYYSRFDILVMMFGFETAAAEYPDWDYYKYGNGVEAPILTEEEFLAFLDDFGLRHERRIIHSDVIRYVDLTTEYVMLRYTNICLLAIALIIISAGSAAGYHLGRQIEISQLTEKRFFENTTHELKTPITAIRGYVEGIEAGVITDFQKTGRVIVSQTERMSGLIDDVLYRARIESGVIPLRKESISAAEAIQNSLMPFEGAINLRGLHVSLDLEDRMITADPDQLDHALSNLISNAIRHAEGVIKISFHDRRLSIWNDVPATTPAELEHAFDRYYTGKNGSTGIGLSLVKSIVDKHGWKIRANAADSGVIITITIS